MPPAGGPVWYARTEQWDRIRGMDTALAADLGQGIVRWDTGQQRPSDWRHEREWRVPGHCINLRSVSPIGVLMGDPGWQFDPGQQLIPGWSGAYPWDWIPVDPPPWVPGLARWWWNADAGQLQQL